MKEATHTSAPAPATIIGKQTSEAFEDAKFPVFVQGTGWISKIDAERMFAETAAKSACEQVLDELLVGFKSNKNIICWLKGPTCAFPEITCRNCIIQHLESLRGGGTQQGGDRRE